MNFRSFLGWLSLNLIFFSTAFSLVALIRFLAPWLAFTLWRGWIQLIKLSMGAVSHFFLKETCLLHILLRNSLSVSIVFLGGLSLIAPLIMALCGCFYALNLFCVNWAPQIASYVAAIALIEITFFLLTASFSSTLAGEAFNVKPDLGSLKKYWLQLKPLKGSKPSWGETFSRNRNALNLYLLAVTGLLLLGGLLEAWLLSLAA